MLAKIISTIATIIFFAFIAIYPFTQVNPNTTALYQMPFTLILSIVYMFLIALMAIVLLCAATILKIWSSH